MSRGACSREELAGLYERRFSMVYQICLVLMKSIPDAEDAAQTVFRKVMERTEPFRDPEHEKAWLIVTARNECRNQLKHWWRTRRAGNCWIPLPGSSPGTGRYGNRWRGFLNHSGWCSISTTTRATPLGKFRIC